MILDLRPLDLVVRMETDNNILELKFGGAAIKKLEGLHVDSITPCMQVQHIWLWWD